MFKLIKYCLTYFSFKKRLKQVFKRYIGEEGDVSVSFLRKRVVITGYTIEAVKQVGDISEYLNSVYPFFKIDKITITPFKIIFQKSKLPKKFKLPKSYKPQGHLIPIGVDENGKILEWDTHRSSSAFLAAPSGTGKTVFLKSILKSIKPYNYLDFKVAIYDPKKDGDFDEFEDNNRIVILRTQDEAIGFHRQLKENIENGICEKVFIIAEEYLQFVDQSKFKNNKTAREQALELTSHLDTISQLYRSKGVFLLVSTQGVNISDQVISLSNFSNRIYSKLSKAQAEVQGVSAEFANRDDMINGRFIVSVNNGKFIVMQSLGIND